MTELTILHVLSDDDAVRDSLDVLFQANSVPVRTYDSPGALLQDLPTNGCLLIDLHSRGSDSIEWSNKLRGLGFSLPTIILVYQAPAGMRSDNAIILQSPIVPGELVAAVKNSLASGQS